MKLWESILFGAGLRPNSTSCWQSEFGSCAVGAALEAVGVKVSSAIHPCEEIQRIWPWTKREALQSEMLDRHYLWCRYGETVPTIADQLHALNSQGISRERIALEFVKPLEDAQADAALPCAQETLERVRA